MQESHKKTDNSKLGYVCLIIAIALIALINIAFLTILGFLYYAYKLSYKREELNFRDKVVITALFILFVVEILLSIYLAVTYVDLYEPYEYVIPE